MTPAAAKACDALVGVLEKLQNAEQRDGQVEMVEQVAQAIEARTPCIIQAGTGTGKTLGYLVPLITARQTAVVATYTKALQDQLAKNDLPMLQTVFSGDETFTWTVLKGRNNYLCRQKLSEWSGATPRMNLDDEPADVSEQVDRIVSWADETDSGDMSDLPFPVSDSTWKRVSVGSDECPGKSRCAHGEDCFTERARERARTCDIVVVNFSLYGLHIQQDQDFLPPHDVVVFDEAHELEDVVSDTASITLTARGITAAADAARAALDRQKLPNALAKSATEFADAVRPFAGTRLPATLPADLVRSLTALSVQSDAVAEAIRALVVETPESLRAANLIGHLRDAVGTFLRSSTDTVCYALEVRGAVRLTAAPLRVDRLLGGVWQQVTPIFTSATIPDSLPQRLGLPIGDDDIRRVRSPFDYERQSMLYLADDLPEPNATDRRSEVSKRVVELIRYSDGGALVLFTSWAALHDTVDDVRRVEDFPYEIHVQNEMPKGMLLESFRSDRRSCLFATRGFFQGVDIPGDTLRLVVIDKVPFPNVRDPLLEARREFAGPGAFSTIDVPMAAAALAQAAGRLIRTATDYGVVAILDPRLARRSYKSAILSAIDRMPETTRLSDVEEFFLRRR